MVRTQLYLTTKEREGLRRVAHRTGRKQSELMRIALDEYLAKNDTSGALKALRAVRGMWKDRTDLPDFDALRRESDRDLWNR